MTDTPDTSAVVRPGRSTCLAVLSIPVVIIVALLAGIVMPWQDKLQFYQDEIDSRVNRLSKMASVASERPLLEEELKRIEAGIVQSDYYIVADKPTLGAAEIQQAIKRIVEQSGGQLTSTQALPAKQDGELTKISVRVRISGDMDATMKTLLALESRKPILILENFTVRSRVIKARRQNRRNRANRNKPLPTPNPLTDKYQLNVNFDAYGYMRTKAS